MTISIKNQQVQLTKKVNLIYYALKNKNFKKRERKIKRKQQQRQRYPRKSQNGNQ